MSEKLCHLVDDIRHCQACAESLPFPPRPVLSASGSAKLLIVGQAPGLRVHETGIAWNDASGDRLRQWMGLDKAVFYNAEKIAILPMGFCYPGRGTSGDLPPLPQCATLWREKLHRHLSEVKLTLLIGQYAQRYYLTKQGQAIKPNSPGSVTDTVKHWQQYLPDFLPLPHPSPRNNIWLRNNPWFELEVLPALRDQVARILESPASNVL